jgi:hypothetical protein
LRDRDAPVPGKKRQHAITADDVPRVFDDARMLGFHGN